MKRCVLLQLAYHILHMFCLSAIKLFQLANRQMKFHKKTIANAYLGSVCNQPFRIEMSDVQMGLGPLRRKWYDFKSFKIVPTFMHDAAK